MTDKVTPTQADRDMAAVIEHEHLRGGLNWPCAKFTRESIVSGNWDHHSTVQRIARHAAQARAEGLAEGKLIGAKLGLDAAGKMLLEAIVNGYPEPEKKTDRCEHGKFGWEGCIACYDDHLYDVATAIRALPPADVVKGGE